MGERCKETKIVLYTLSKMYEDEGNLDETSAFESEQLCQAKIYEIENFFIIYFKCSVAEDEELYLFKLKLAKNDEFCELFCDKKYSRPLQFFSREAAEKHSLKNFVYYTNYGNFDCAYKVHKVQLAVADCQLLNNNWYFKLELLYDLYLNQQKNSLLNLKISLNPDENMCRE